MAQDEGLHTMSIEGGRRVALRQMKMDDDVLTHLQKSFEDAEGDLEKRGYSACVDYPRIPGHTYYEGYLHAHGASGLPKTGVNPRKGVNMTKPAAPLALRAFLACFRAKNAAVLREVADAVTAAVPDTCFAALVQNSDIVFADVAAQVHCHDAIPSDEVRYHVDAGNSLLHLAISVRGSRTLHVRGKPCAAEGEAPVEEGDARKRPLTKFAQSPGDVYLSSPNFFPHGVEYPEYPSWEERIVALQCRFLITEDQLSQMGLDMFNGRTTGLDKAMYSVLSRKGVQLPTLAEVLAAEAALEEEEAEAQRRSKGWFSRTLGSIAKGFRGRSRDTSG